MTFLLLVHLVALSAAVSGLSGHPVFGPAGGDAGQDGPQTDGRAEGHGHPALEAQPVGADRDQPGSDHVHMEDVRQKVGAPPTPRRAPCLAAATRINPRSPVCRLQHHGSAAGPAAPQHEQPGARQLRRPAEQHRGVRRGSVPPGRAARRAGNLARSGQAGSSSGPVLHFVSLYVCVLLQGLYSAVSEILQHLKEQFPAHSQHAKVRSLAALLLYKDGVPPEGLGSLQ